MYLEERIREIEDRIAALEGGGASNPLSEVEEKLAALEEKGNRLAKRTQALESRFESIGDGKPDEEIAERVDQCETTCHDLLSADDTLRERCDSFDRRITGLNKQLEGFLDQLAELDSRNTKPEGNGLDHRLRQIETDFHDLRSLRGLRSEITERLAEFDRALAKSRTRLDEMEDSLESLKGRSGAGDLTGVQGRLAAVETSFEPLRQLGTKLDALANEARRRLEELTQRVDRVDGNHRDFEGRWTSIDRESIPNRLRNVEERLAGADGGHRLTSLTHRLESVERDAGDVRKEVSWLRDRPQATSSDGWARALAGGGLLAGIAAAVLVMWPWHTLRANRFLLVDDHRREVGELVSNDEGACLELQDRGGQRRLYLAATGAGSMLTLSDENGTERARLSEDKLSGAGLSVVDPTSHRQIWCGVRQEPAIALVDNNGDVRGSISLPETGPELTLRETSGRPCVRLITRPTDNGLRVYDPDGRLRVGVGMCPDGAAVNLFDPKEQRKVVLCSADQSSALAFLGKDERQRTTLGMTEKDESILNLHDNVGRQRVLLIASDDDAKVEVLDRETNVLFSGP